MHDLFNSIWLTVVILSVLVVVHEYGHFLLARIFGVKVFEFSVGFGPLIGKFIRNDIQFSFRWFLLGGFCKIAGMDNALEGTVPEEGTEKVSKKESFQFLPLWKQITVIAAGPIFNFLFAVILFFITATCIGYPEVKDVPIIGGVSSGSPASYAGLMSGDRVAAINNQPIQKWSEMTALIQKYGGQPVQLKIIRHGGMITKEIVPKYDTKEKRYLLGISLETLLKRESIIGAAQKSITLPWLIIQQFAKIFAGKVKLQLMGPIGIVNMVEQTLHFPFLVSLANNLFYAAEISISLFIFNLLPLPLPLLDGGWIIIMLLERVLRRQFTPEQKAMAQMIGIVAVIILGILIGYNDVIRWNK